MNVISHKKEGNMDNKKHMGMKRKNAISNTIIYIILIAMAVIWLIPFFRRRKRTQRLYRASNGTQ